MSSRSQCARSLLMAGSAQAETLFGFYAGAGTWQQEFSGDVASEIELTQSDAVLYYELLDNVVSLDLGIAARWIDGEIEVASESAVAQAEFEGVLPLLYARGRVDLPLTGLWVGAEAMGLAFDGHSLIDASVQVGWTSPVGLGAELGWRTLRLGLDSVDDIDNAEIDMSGPYAAVNFYF